MSASLSTSHPHNNPQLYYPVIPFHLRLAKKLTPTAHPVVSSALFHDPAAQGAHEASSAVVVPSVYPSPCVHFSTVFAAHPVLSSALFHLPAAQGAQEEESAVALPSV